MPWTDYKTLLVGIYLFAVGVACYIGVCVGVVKLKGSPLSASTTASPKKSVTPKKVN